MNSYSQNGFAQILIVLFLVASVGIGLYLVQRPQTLKPQASTQGVTLTLQPQQVQITEGQEFNVDLFMDTKGKVISAAEIYVNFDSTYLEALRTSTQGSFFPRFFEDTPSISPSQISLIGLSEPGELKTDPGNIVTITFKAKNRITDLQGTQISIGTDTLVTEMSSDTNALGERIPSTVRITALATPTPTPTSTPAATPTATPTPTPTPAPKAGDMNGDGKVDLFDFSYLLSKWGSADTKADLNKSGKVDIWDYSILFSNWGT